MLRWLLLGPYQLILIVVSVFFIWAVYHVIRELEGIRALLNEIRDRLPRA
jgi:hypothetical protein